ncbi:MAG: Asp-tRNA(Asn)/Glu-tRNA(Gln) amidotransferase subunit GatA [Desulfobacterales bacterium]|nr:Asp-tRNA(Asn)/Glu-tRNA(Gln) amidotransferase subunit GatA [Desulfobacterales bacterium]
MPLYELTIEAAADLLQRGEISSEDLTRAVLARIAALDDRVGAYLTVDREGALEQARRADELRAAGQATALTGIPLGIKDVICTRGLRTTCASRLLDNFIPPYDATVMQRLRQAGAVVLGKTNMDEFAMGSSTENSGFGPTANPWDLSRIPGGSSGGSAAAVAANMCLGSLGSDTGGSIRQPASHCGIVGLKPTYGRVSRYGLVAFASSLDQIGPLGKSVMDCALLMNVICGHDPRDSTSVSEPVPDFTRLRADGLQGLKIGLPVEYFEAQGLDADVRQAVAGAVATVEALGAETVEISLPHTQYGVAAYYIIAPSEASSNLARYDGVRFGVRREDDGDLLDMFRRTRSAGFGAEVKRRIILGTYALSAGYYDAYYGKASQVRTLIIEDFRKAFAQCDVLLSPVAPTPAFAIGEKTADPLTMYLSDVFTLCANLAGIPGISIPCGFSSAGLPIGLQIMGRHFDEARLLAVAHHFEQATDFHKRKPEL